MRGRGTRTADHIGKKKFVIYDFFENHTYFNDSDTDIFIGKGRGHAPGGETGPRPPEKELINLGLTDEWLYAVTYVEVGPEGERVDKREYITNWKETVRKAEKEDPILQKIRSGKLLTEQEEKELIDKFNRPEMYFNEENLRRAYKRPGGNLIDFIKAALEGFKLKSKEEEVTENFQAWLVSQSLSPQQAQYLSILKNRGIARGKIRLEDLFEPPLSVLNAAELGVELFGEKGLKEIIHNMNESIFQKAI
jgi:type I restriction enzyme R subunit